MRLANLSAFVAVVISPVLLLVAAQVDAPAQTAAQSVPAYIATADVTTAHESYSSIGYTLNWGDCGSAGSADGLFPYATSGSDQYTPQFPGSGIKLIKQGGKWIPTSAGTAVSPSGGGYGTNSFLSSSGTIISTSYFFNSAVNATWVEVAQLGDGKLVTWTSQVEQFNLPLDNNGCFQETYRTTDNSGSASLILQPYTPQSSLTLVDPTNVGGQILPLQSSVDPNSVPNAPGALGLAADGVSAVPIVYHSLSSQPVTLTLTGAGATTGAVAPSKPIGTLTNYVANYPSNPQPGAQTTIQLNTPLDATTCNSVTDKAGTSNCTFLALLWSPGSMPYSSTTTPERVILTITANQADANGVQGSVSSGAILQPPPVVFVHGVWDSAASWGTFEQWMQQSGYPTSGLFPADYQVSNYLTFEDSSTQIILGRTIADALTDAARQGIVARKVDVVAHSMGGLVTLYFEDQGGTPPTVVTLPANPVHKLVTIGTPYDGSALATELWNIRNYPPASAVTNPLFGKLCNAWGSNPGSCTPTVLLGATGHKIVSNDPKVDSAIQSLMLGIAPIPTSYTHSAIVGETDGIPARATELFLDAILATYDPGESVSSLLNTPNDAIVGASSQSANSTDSVTVTGVVHTSLLPNASWTQWFPGPAYSLLDYPGEISSSAVFSQVLSSLMGNTLSGTVAQPATLASKSSSGAMGTVVKRRTTAVQPGVSTAPAPLFDLTGYTQVPISNATFLPVTGSTLTINTPVSIAVTSSTKTISETLLFQQVADPTDFAIIYSTQTPFSLSFVPTRLGSMSFVVFAVFTDNTFGTATLNYTLTPVGSPLDIRLPNPPVASLGVGQQVTVDAIADYSNGPVDVTTSATYTARSGGSSVFSVGTNGSIMSNGNGVDWLDATYQGLVGSTLITVGQCTYTLTPANQVVDVGGATTRIQVSTQNGCAWTASTDSTWLTLPQGTGSGSATLSATATANASGSQRLANIKVGNVTVSVIQPATSCSYVPSTSTVSIPAGGGSGTISVTTSCPFVSSSNETWATATALSQSSVAYFVTANPSQQSRTATLSIGTSQVTLTQAGALVTPTVSMMPSATGITTAQGLTVTVAVNGGTGNPTPTGSVTLTSGSYASAATAITSGSATINIPAGSLATGSDTLTASYMPDTASTSIYNSSSGTNSVTVTAILLGQTPTVSILVNFDGANGAFPRAPALVQVTNGNYYGTTDQGGTKSAGTIFDATSQGSLTTLYSLCCESTYAAGDAPSGLTQAADGVLYGTTALSGLNTCKISVTGETAGCGTIFQLGLGGDFTTLYNFGGSDGSSPGGLVQGTDGNMYGSTSVGGPNNQAPFPFGPGTIFKFVPGFGLTTLYSFCASSGCSDGFNPGPLVQGADGNFYGATLNGGGGLPPGGIALVQGGTLFKITPQGTLTTLYDFCSQKSCSDGANPIALVQASNGDFYGTTTEGGMNVGNPPCNDSGGMGGDGTIFEMTPGSAPVTLHTFDGNDGATPNSALVQASDGNFYGTTACGGANGAGTIFQITPAGVFTSLYSFTGSPALGGGPSGLLQATNGTFYGTTPAGGTNSDGTLYSLSIGLSPFVETLPTSGGVGAPVLILGNNLTGATGVNFNGTAATFTVVSDSEIQATVPVGAATGSVQVTTQSATLNSNVPFQVTTQMVAATPTISPVAGTYASSQTVTISDATAGAAIYYTTDGSTPTTASNLYSGAFAIPFSETLQAIAIANGYSASAVSTAAYIIQNPSNPAPALTSISPAYAFAGGAAFTLTVAGSTFTAQSTIYWGASALATQYVSASQLSAQVTAAEIAAAGTTAVTVQTPAPGGGTSTALQFDVGATGQAAPVFTTLTVFVNPGSSATYAVTLPTSATNVSVMCLNLPKGASCSYSSTAGALTITTSSTTPLGTYQITVVFTETLPGAVAALALLPILLLPLAFARRRWASRGYCLLAGFAFVLMVVAMSGGCGGGGGGGGSGGGGGGGGGSQTHQATSIGAVTLIVQ
jgi:uncharacterized repeat protein (TIGR03803 family)